MKDIGGRWRWMKFIRGRWRWMETIRGRWKWMKDIEVDLQPWSKRLGTLKKMRRENTPCLLKVYLTCYKCLEMLLKEPVSAVPPSPQQCWLCWKRFEAVTSTLNRGGRGERKCVIFTSCLVNVPRVLARVVPLNTFINLHEREWRLLKVNEGYWRRLEVNEGDWR